MERKTLVQFIKYCIVGSFNTILNIFILYMCLETFQLSSFLSVMAANIASLIFHFITNAIFTFSISKFKFYFFIKYIFLFIFNSIISYLIVFSCKDIFMLPNELITLINTIVVFPLGFLFSKFWVFR